MKCADSLSGGSGRTIALTVECSGDNFIHLCNNSIQKESDKMGEMIDGNMWDLAEFRRHLCREYRPLSEYRRLFATVAAVDCHSTAECPSRPHPVTLAHTLARLTRPS